MRRVVEAAETGDADDGDTANPEHRDLAFETGTKSFQDKRSERLDPGSDEHLMHSCQSRWLRTSLSEEGCVRLPRQRLELARAVSRTLIGGELTMCESHHRARDVSYEDCMKAGETMHQPRSRVQFDSRRKCALCLPRHQRDMVAAGHERC
jgi:hypothetical protein